MSEKDNIIRIQMLGGLYISRNGRVLSADISRTRQVSNLAGFLIANRNRELTQDDIMNALWADEESENPANALKNLAYRLRNTLKALDNPGEKISYIKIKRGVYSWNNDNPCIVDIEEMEKFRDLAANPSIGDTDKIDLYERALDLYKGEFLPKSSFEEWVISLNEYYSRAYLDCAYSLIALLKKQNRYEKIVSVCERAVEFMPFEEKLHENMIRALATIGKQEQAITHYENVNNMFYKELGVRTSDSLRGLYQEITSGLRGDELDIITIKEDLKEGNDTDKAFLCNYEVFKNLYRLEARAAERRGLSIFVGLIKISHRDNRELPSEMLQKAMSALEVVLVDSLRRGDAVTRFSGTQFAVMLSLLTYEDGDKVLDRIERNFKRKYKNSSILMSRTLYPIDPV